MGGLGARLVFVRLRMCISYPVAVKPGFMPTYRRLVPDGRHQSGLLASDLAAALQFIRNGTSGRVPPARRENRACFCFRKGRSGRRSTGACLPAGANACTVPSSFRQRRIRVDRLSRLVPPPVGAASRGRRRECCARHRFGRAAIVNTVRSAITTCRGR